jgi:hypothetical protein
VLLKLKLFIGNFQEIYLFNKIIKVLEEKTARRGLNIIDLYQTVYNSSPSGIFIM